jgi:two-component system sensor histidine kinase BarA
VDGTERIGFDVTIGPAGRRPRILVVDDNEATRRVAQRQLAGLGFEVSTAANGPEALDRLAAEPCDLVLLDGMMPGMDGAATAREIRRREGVGEVGRIPIIALTASALPEDQDRMLAAGMDDLVAKPPELDELGVVLARWLPAEDAWRRGVIRSGAADRASLADPAPLVYPAPLVDPDAVGRLTGLGDATFVARIVRLFLADAAGRVGQVDEAVATGDRPAAVEALQALESIAAVLGATAIRQRAAEAAQGDMRAASDLAPMLEATTVRLWQLLEGAQ